MTDFEQRLQSALHEETIDISARSTLGEEMVARGTRARRRRRVAGGVAALAVLAAAIPIWQSVDTSSGRLAPTGPSNSHVIGPTTGPTSPHQTSSLPTWRSRPVTVVHQASPPPEVTDLRAGQHSTYDRVVVDLTGDISGYRVRYVSQLTSPSGAPVSLPGNAFLSITLTPAAAHNDSGQSVFHGATSQALGMPVLRGVAMTEDFEGYVSFGLALSRHSDFRVFELTSPTRLVVDVRH